MTHIVFYEKPGCGGNARQRQALLAAGHTLAQRNLLITPWTASSLLPFLGPLPVAQWFNRAAPAVKSGQVQPDLLGAEQALALLLAQPLLIRRPLMQRTDLPEADPAARHVGFDTAAVHAWVGLDEASPGAAGAATGAAQDAVPGAARASLEGCAAVSPHACQPG